MGLGPIVYRIVFLAGSRIAATFIESVRHLYQKANALYYLPISFFIWCAASKQRSLSVFIYKHGRQAKHGVNLPSLGLSVYGTK